MWSVVEKEGPSLSSDTALERGERETDYMGGGREGEGEREPVLSAPRRSLSQPRFSSLVVSRGALSGVHTPDCIGKTFTSPGPVPGRPYTNTLCAS